MKKPELGDVIIFSNHTIGRVVAETHGKEWRQKLRCISTGKSGRPYTYQRWSTTENVRRHIKKVIGAEELLNIIYNVYN